MNAPFSHLITEHGASMDEMELAARVHYSFLPNGYANGSFDIAVDAKPLNALGGDYCSILPLSEHRVVLCLCDAVGHGVASALFASRINSFVLSHVLRLPCPCRLIQALNAHLCQRLTTSGMYTSFFSLFVDAQRGEVIYAGAGHPPALKYRAADDRIERFASVTTLLGIEHPLPLECRISKARLAPGDKIMLFTDGLLEVRDGRGSIFGVDGLGRFLRRHGHLDSKTFNQRSFWHLGGGGRGRVRDDVLLMTLSVMAA